MIAEFGHFALLLALGIAALQATVPLLGAARGRVRWMAFGSWAATAQFGCLALAFAALTQAYVRADFSVLNVAMNSHSLKPMLYKVSGVWGNHEGSLLLWVLVLAFFGVLVALFARNLPAALKARTLSVQAMISVGFLLFMSLTSNPFMRLFPPPPEGRDLNPLLQDPGLALHPPMLYVGYVGLSIVFSLAVAALIAGRADRAWAHWARPWALLAWSFLGGGIALGSWWAYYELGWGGFWFWDPVENASFMPWLIATALLHSLIVTEKRGAMAGWTVLLAILAFAFSLMGTFLVRSGVLTSVHAFANDPDRGIFILLLLTVAVGGALALYAWRGGAMSTGIAIRPISREGAMALNNLFLVTAAATILLGTLYPLFLEVMSGEKITVGPPYFNRTFAPFVLVLAPILAVAPLLGWKRGDLPTALRHLRVALALALGTGIAAALIIDGRSVMAATGLGIAAWLFAAAFHTLWLAVRPPTRRGEAVRRHLYRLWLRLRALPPSRWGMTFAHAGIAVVIAGVVGAGSLATERIAAMRPGNGVMLGDLEFRLERVRTVPGPNYQAERADFTVYDATGHQVATLSPERRRYHANGQSTTEAAIATRPLYDLYAVISEPTEPGLYGVRLYRKPLAVWLWLGAGMIVAGGFLSLAGRRRPGSGAFDGERPGHGEKNP